MSANNKAHINGNTSGHTASVQEQLNFAIQDNGGVARIETVIRQRLDEQGWTQALREYTTALLRSGECKSFDEVKGKVDILVRMRKEGDEDGRNGIVGGQVPDLSIGREVQEGCVSAVKKELEEVCVVDS